MQLDSDCHGWFRDTCIERKEAVEEQWENGLDGRQENIGTRHNCGGKVDRKQ